MSKHKVLTPDEFKDFKINPVLIQLITNYLHTRNLTKKQINILDWGSGCGRTIAVLKEQRYNTFGVEIDPIPYNNGLEYFRSHFDEPTAYIKLINNDCATPFKDNQFDIVYFEQVLEHVSHIQLLANELMRITKPGGQQLHIFAYKLHFIERHLHMPMIHWFPKNKIRYYMIYLYLSLGIDPKWSELSGINISDRAPTYFTYSIDKTCYR